MSNGDIRRSTCPPIAVVDDDQAVRAALANLLDSAGYLTCSFAAAEDFLASDCLHQAACAILDVKLQGMSGFELKERLNVLQSSLPVIFISAQGGEMDRQRATRLGAVAFLSKPIDADSLLAQVRSVITNCGEPD
ncbi:response regulator [Herbaspirillum lusitanum]|uniref:Response regulator n=1 Tax=Herbaspirillum lusitanum TaxID=213312 RepID=A0ABW9A2K4_9BURK